MTDTHHVKKKKKDKQITIRLMEDREYVGPVKTSAIGERFLEGVGTYTWEEAGMKYEGPFKASKIMGKGKARWADGRMYHGDFINGKRHGDGMFVASDGQTRYSGGWVSYS